MKKSLVKIASFVLLTGLLVGCSDSSSGYPRENHSKESIEKAYIYINESGSPEYDYYYAYSATGELMFSIREYAYEIEGISGVTGVNWYTKDTLQSASYSYPKESYLLMVDSTYDTLKREIKSNSLLTYDGTLQYLSLREFTYSSDGLTSMDKLTNYTPNGSSKPVSSHSVYNSEGKLLESYSVDGNGNETIREKLEYNEDGSISSLTEYSYDSDGAVTELLTSYTYDSNGRVLTYITKDKTSGEVSVSMSYKYFLNDDGTVSEQVSRNELTEKESIYKRIYMKVSETDYPKDYVGYWQCQNDEENYFIEISCNGLLCIGNFDSSFGVMTPQIYGFYEVQADGTLILELYENGCTTVEDYLQGVIYMEKGKLVFDELTFDKVE